MAYFKFLNFTAHNCQDTVVGGHWARGKIMKLYKGGGGTYKTYK